jgi:hypothetical protein
MTIDVGLNPGRNTFAFADSGSYNQYWTGANYTINDVGRFTALHAYFGGDGASCTGNPCLWVEGSIESTLYSGSTIASGTRSTNGQSLVTLNIDFAFASGLFWEFGWFRNSGDSDVFGYSTTGTFLAKIVAGSSPNNATGGTSGATAFGQNGGLTAYGTYFPATIYVRRSGSWVKIQSLVRRSAAWTAPKVYVRRSGSWSQLGMVIADKVLDWKRQLETLIVWPDRIQEKGLLVWEYDNPKSVGSNTDWEAKILRPRPYQLVTI